MKNMNILVLIIAGLLSSCKDTNDFDSKNNSFENRLVLDFIENRWVLDSVEDIHSKIVSHYPDTLEKHIEIAFSDSNTVELYGYCNSGSAEFELSENEISFTNVTITEKACPFVGGEWENYLYNLLEVESYDLNETTLYLFSNTNLNLYFSKKE